METDMSNSHLEIDIPCRRVVQNNVEFLLGTVKASQLMKLVSVTSRAITGFDEKGEPLYNDFIQRKPNAGRVTSIKDYLIYDEEACFPNNILVSVPSAVINNEIGNDEETNLVISLDKIVLKGKSPLYLQIFDGQHRFRGVQVAIEELEKLGDYERAKRFGDFEFVISFFIDAEPEFQAMMFSIINRTPVKVAQDLVYDLFGLTKEDSPQKTCLAVALQLNGTRFLNDNKETPGPFYKRIRLLAKKEKEFDSPISQSMFIKTILTLISTSLRASEVDRVLPRKALEGGGNERTVFRKYYSEEKDNLIYKTLLNYFAAVREVFVYTNGRSYWDVGVTPINAFQKTVGFLALIDLLVAIMPFAEQSKNISILFFKNYLEKAQGINLLNQQGESSYPFSSRGRTMLSQDLLSMVF